MLVVELGLLGIGLLVVGFDFGVIVGLEVFLLG